MSDVPRYRITHRTRYRYAEDVTASYGQAHQLPRDLPGQRVVSAHLVVSPAPGDRRDRLDHHGNRCTYFEVLVPHRELVVTATSVVDVDRSSTSPLLAGRSWESVRDATDTELTPEGVEARSFRLESPMVPLGPAVRSYAEASFPAGRPLVEAVVDLTRRIHRDFEFVPGATSVGTTIDELLTGRRGVCQDFAHLAVACLRSMGLAGRYVSGYLETTPPPGRPRSVGADVSHAWAATWLPGGGWIELDPTNDTLVDDRYVTTAWGRDYGDVPPLKGVIYTDGVTTDLTVSVDVVRISGADAPGGGFAAQR